MPVIDSKFMLPLQDVRVWGQDASSVNRVTTDANDGLMIHEAWAEISLVDTGKVIKNFSIKDRSAGIGL